MGRWVLEYRGDEVAEFAGDDDASSEDGDAPEDGEVTGAVFGGEDVLVDEADEEVGFGCSAVRGGAGGGAEEALLCGPDRSQKKYVWFS